MPDKFSPDVRSRIMSRIKRAHTKPERIVRGLLHKAGYRFRIQLAGVPGRPDIAFPSRQRAIFIHGCFWHQHPGCRHARIPKTREDFWAAKFARNRERDERLLAEAAEAGWKTLVVWECEVADEGALRERLARFIGPPKLATGTAIIAVDGAA